MTPVQWADIMAQINRFFEHVVNVFHHPEVIIIGVPSLVIFFLILWQLFRIANALEAIAVK